MRFAAIILVVLTAAFAARAEKSYVPMLDTGGHMALVNDIAFTPDGSQLVSGSDDKTIRVWDVATGKTVRTIRGEAAPVTWARSSPSRCRRTANGWRRGDG